MADASPSRARRRLRQRSTRTAPREIVSVDSSSDAFEPSDVDKSPVKKTRGRKRLRRASSTSGGEDEDISTSTTTTASQSSDPASQASNEWECTRCTYVNEPQRLACEICLSTRAMPTTQTRRLSAWLTTAVTAGTSTQRSSPKKAVEAAPVETIDSSTDDDDSRDHNSTMQPRRNRKPRGSSDAESGLMWTEMTQAQRIDELCVQRKKVQEVQEWLQRSIPSHGNQHHSIQRLLFLCGPPGSGKSTTVRHLATTMGVTIKEWRDNASAGKLQYQRHLRDEFQVTQLSAWDDFIDFINRSVNYSTLQIAALPDKRSRKRPLGHKQPHAVDGRAHSQLILVENWPQNPFGNSQDSSVWDEKLTAAFRQITNPAANVQYPVVCIFSDVRDKKVDVSQLAKIFSDDVVRSPYTSIINFNPVTAAQMKKVLSRTLDKLDYSISSEDLTNIIDRSDGDVRHAMNMAQLYHKRKSLPRPKRTSTKAKKSTLPSLEACTLGDVEDTDASRDPFFSDFHIAGKLLHSKNIKLSGTQSTSDRIDDGKLLEFDRILDSSAMPLDRVLSLIHSNCTNYFTEVDDLADALDLMSQSETWLHDSYRTTSSSVAFKTSHDIVRSMVVRSIALTNKHPAPSAFRPITAPRTYETTRRMVSSRQESIPLQQAMTGGSSSSHPYLCRGDVFSFEIQPFADIIRLRQNAWPSNPKEGSSVHKNELQLVDDEIESSDDDGW